MGAFGLFDYEGYMQLYKKEWNPYKDAMETWYYDDDTESFVIKNTFDVSDILKANKIQANASLDKRYGDGLMHPVAEIPNVFISKFKTEYNIDVFSTDPSEQLRLRKLLEDPEFSFLKTTTKKLWRPR